MKKDKVIHFVGFITRLNQQEFVDQLTPLAKTFDSGSFVLQEKTEAIGKYKYISQHEIGQQDFRISFMKSKDSENFPDQKTKVVMIGGYSPAEIGCPNWDESSGEKIIIFSSHDNIDMDFYRSLSGPGSLNIYEAFYESCRYSHIIELFTQETKSTDLLDELLKRKEGIEVAAYRECLTSIC